MKVVAQRPMERMNNEPAPNYKKTETSARDAYYQSAFESTTTEDEFMLVSAPTLSKTSIEQLTKQVDNIDGGAKWEFWKTKKPATDDQKTKLLSDIQSQIKDYQTVTVV